MGDACLHMQGAGEQGGWLFGSVTVHGVFRADLVIELNDRQRLAQGFHLLDPPDPVGGTVEACGLHLGVMGQGFTTELRDMLGVGKSALHIRQRLCR
jgi:hypothetical protein